MANIKKVKFEMWVNFETMPNEKKAERIERVKNMFSKNPYVVFGSVFPIKAGICGSHIHKSIFSNQVLNQQKEVMK